MVNLPFEEKGLGENVFLRLFDPQLETNELKWHIDLEDRIIQVVENTELCVNTCPYIMKVGVKKGKSCGGSPSRKSKEENKNLDYQAEQNGTLDDLKEKISDL